MTPQGSKSFFAGKKIIKTALLSGLIFSGALVLLLSLGILIFQQQIKQLLLDSLNRQLTAQVEVGSIRMSLFRHLPYAAISFTDVQIASQVPLSEDEEKLLEAGNLYFKFGLWNVLFNHYVVREVVLKDATLNLRVNPDGTNNYQIWRQDTLDQENEFGLDIKRIHLQNTKLSFTDLRSGHDFQIAVENGNMSGNFGKSKFRLGARAQLYVGRIMVDSALFVQNMPARIDVVLQVQDHTKFIFEKGDLVLNENSFELQGFLHQQDTALVIDTHIYGKNLHIGRLMDDMPDFLQPYLDGYRARGILQFSAGITGQLSESSNPSIQANFSVSDALLTHRQSGLRLGNLQFDGSIDNGSDANLSTTTLQFNNFSTTLANGYLRGDFRIYNFLNPRLGFNMWADANASDLANLLRISYAKNVGGRVKLDLHFEGGMSYRNKFSARDLLSARASGTIQHTNLSFDLANKPLSISNLNGTFLFSNSDLIVESFSGMAGNSDFHISGEITNVLPYLFIDNEGVTVSARLQSTNLNFNELLKHSVVNADTTYRLTFSERLSFSLKVDIDHLLFGKFQANNLKGEAFMRNRKFFAQNISFDAMQGRVRATGFIDNNQGDHLDVGAQLDVRDVNIQDLFYQMNNFGQDGLTYSNLSGVLTSDIDFKSRWSSSFSIDPASIETTANIRIEEGSLVNYGPMVALSRFLRFEDLQRVTFSTLENQIRIHNRKIVIPDMEVNSSALNMKLSGEHHFDNRIDYRMQLLLSEVLGSGQPHRDSQEQFGTVIDDGLWRTRLFLRIGGTATEPTIAYDARGVREKIRDDLRRERESLRDVLRREFGTPQSEHREAASTDSLPNRTTTDRRRRTQNQTGFTIEWEETDPRHK